MTIQEDSSVTESSSMPLLLPLSSLVHQNDDLTRFLDWIFTADAKVDFKSLAKKLPNTVQDIRIGICNPDDLARAAIDTISHRFISKQLPSDCPLYRGPDDDIYDLLFQASTAHAILTRKTGELYKSFLGDLRVNYGQALSNRIWHSLPCDFFFSLQQAFEKTCVAWQDRLTARFFRGQPRGAFRHACTIFHVSKEELKQNVDQMTPNIAEGISTEVLQQHISKLHGQELVIAELVNDLHFAAGDIASGLDVTRDTCWECNAVLKCKFLCAKRSVAVYCGIECQGDAWKDGHKRACTRLGPKYAA